MTYLSDADRFAYQLDRDTVRDHALEIFSKMVGEFRDHQILSCGLKSLVEKYFDWVNQNVPEGLLDADPVEKPTLHDFEPFLRLKNQWGIEVWKSKYAGEWNSQSGKSSDQQQVLQQILLQPSVAATSDDDVMQTEKEEKEKETTIVVVRDIPLGVVEPESTKKRGEIMDPSPPTIVNVLRGEEVTSVSISRSPRSLHCVIVTVDGGDTFVGGDNALGQLGFSPQVSDGCSLGVCATIPAMAQVSCGGGHGVGVSDKGGLYAWGCSMDGRLGVGLMEKVGVEDKLERTTFASSPVSPALTEEQLDQLRQAKSELATSRHPIVLRKAQEVVDLHALQSPMAGLQVHSVSCGVLHTVCIAGATRSLFSWGSGVGYRLGHSDCVTTSWPRKIESMKFPCETVQCCNTYTGILTTDGSVYVWGRGAKGQLGLGGSSSDMTSIRPRRVRYRRRKRQKQGLGSSSSVNGSSQDDGAASNNSSSSLYAADEARIDEIALSDTHGSALDLNGKVWTWGAAPSIGRRCRVLPTYTSAVKKEPRGGGSVYCVPFHLPQPAWDPIPQIVKRLRKYPIGR